MPMAIYGVAGDAELGGQAVERSTAGLEQFNAPALRMSADSASRIPSRAWLGRQWSPGWAKGEKRTLAGIHRPQHRLDIRPPRG
jgi:hypothetical protein